MTLPILMFPPYVVSSVDHFAGTTLFVASAASRLRDRRVGLLGGIDLAERTLVFVREDLHELRACAVPMVDDLARTQRAGPAVMIVDQLLQQHLVCDRLAVCGAVQQVHILPCLLLFGGQHFLERDHRGVATLGKAAVLVVHVGDASAHAGGEVAPGLAEHDDGAAGHVFATMIAGAFDDRGRTRQPHREALARDAAEERLAARRTVEHGVADDDVLRCVAAKVDARPHDDTPAAQVPCRCSRWRRRSGTA